MIIMNHDDDDVFNFFLMVIILNSLLPVFNVNLVTKLKYKWKSCIILKHFFFFFFFIKKIK